MSRSRPFLSWISKAIRDPFALFDWKDHSLQAGIARQYQSPLRLALFNTSPSRFDALDDETISSLRYAGLRDLTSFLLTLSYPHNLLQDQGETGAPPKPVVVAHSPQLSLGDFC